MEPKEEYHDPDYPDAGAPAQEEVRVLSEEEKIEKIKSIIQREFLNELETRESEVMLLEQRMTTSRRMLHQLRYAIVNQYYGEQKLQLSKSAVDDDLASQHEYRARAEALSLLRDGQRRLHPSVRKLLGKQTVDLQEIFKTREPRNKARKDYSAMVQSRNYTIAADATKSLRPEEPLEPSVSPSTSASTSASASTSTSASRPARRVPLVAEKVVTVDEATRNDMKRRYRIIVGNTSKYAPPASRADRSTHKWLLYVRGPPEHPDPSLVLTHVVARLHHSYAPHHTVHVYKPPFHISRRGWGEFPATVELHFRLPAVNRPATVEHTIKLDRNYTGLQTLGSETVVEVWLYSTPEMLPFEYSDGLATDPPDAPPDASPDAPPDASPDAPPDAQGQSEPWMEFFTKDVKELDVDEMIIKPIKKEPIEENTEMDSEMTVLDNFTNKEHVDSTMDDCSNKKVPDMIEEMQTDETKPVMKRIMKYIDSATGKIFYLEMDRKLDLSKVQEIVINNQKAKISPIKSNGLKTFRKKKGGVSLLKPEVKNQLKCESKDRQMVRSNSNHIENDHCYLGNGWMSDVTTDKNDSASDVKVIKGPPLYDSLCSVMCRLTDVRMAVNYLLKNIPVVTEMARDEDYLKDFPFVVENEERYWKLDFAKRRNIEWSRAKLINRIITEHLRSTEPVWRTKQILIYSRLHGFHPIRPETAHRAPETNEWSSWNDLENSRKLENNIKELYPSASDICSLTLFDSEDILNSTLESVDRSDSDEEIDVVCSESVCKVKTEIVQESEGGLVVLPVEDEEDRLRFLFVEKICADIGVELRNEDIGNGYSYSAVHSVLLSAFKSFAEELVRAAAAAASDPDGSLWSRRRAGPLRAAHVYSARGGRRRLLAAAALGARAPDTADPL